jgi:hypothetical protein
LAAAHDSVFSDFYLEERGMGIARGMVSFLCECKRDLGLAGKLLELGKQDIRFSSDQMTHVFKKFGFPPPSEGSAITDVSLFQALGYHTVESMDANAYEGADHIHDMNVPIPEALKGQYDVVFDGGTLEHIFNFPQCLKNIYDLLKPEGIVIHASPSHNYVDHGFYMFSPTVFFEYYTTNKFKIHKSYIFEHKMDYNKRWLVYEYSPGSIDHMSFGGWGTELLGIFFVAQKTAASTNGTTPQQDTYIRAWRNAALPQDVSAVNGLKGKVKSLLRTHPTAYNYAANAYARLNNLFKIQPRVIARY